MSVRDALRSNHNADVSQHDKIRVNSSAGPMGWKKEALEAAEDPTTVPSQIMLLRGERLSRLPLFPAKLPALSRQSVPAEKRDDVRLAHAFISSSARFSSSTSRVASRSGSSGNDGLTLLSSIHGHFTVLTIGGSKNPILGSFVR